MEHKNNQILSFQNFVTEKYELNESFEVIFSDGISQKKDFKSKSKAINFMRDKISTNKKLKYIAVQKRIMDHVLRSVFRRKLTKQIRRCVLWIN